MSHILHKEFGNDAYMKKGELESRNSKRELRAKLVLVTDAIHVVVFPQNIGRPLVTTLLLLVQHGPKCLIVAVGM
jgi:hypothetical protein